MTRRRLLGICGGVLRVRDALVNADFNCDPDPRSTSDEAESLQSYYKTRFFRFLVSLRKITQHATHSTYLWVPIQKWDRTWSDAALFAKYEINDTEQAYIESMIRPMDGTISDE